MNALFNIKKWNVNFGRAESINRTDEYVYACRVLGGPIQRDKAVFTDLAVFTDQEISQTRRYRPSGVHRPGGIHRP